MAERSDSNPAEAPACAVGDTRACLGPGQCSGAQSCLLDRSGWTACDCGGTDSGLGGSPPDGSTGGAGGGAAGVGGSAASGGQAGADAAVGGSGNSAGSSGVGGTGGIAGNAGVGGGSSDAGSDVASTKCSGLPGSPMVDVGPFCIDRHEATNAEYKQFLDAVGTPAPGSQPTGCEFNASFHPNEHCSTGFDVQNKPDYAVYCVDWCDAYAYCKWAGKHLCGNIGGGPLNDQNFEDYSVSQWGYACSNGGQTNYPYGDTSQVGTCAIGVD